MGLFLLYTTSTAHGQTVAATTRHARKWWVWLVFIALVRATLFPAKLATLTSLPRLLFLFRKLVSDHFNQSMWVTDFLPLALTAGMSFMICSKDSPVAHLTGFILQHIACFQSTEPTSSYRST